MARSRKMKADDPPKKGDAKSRLNKRWHASPDEPHTSIPDVVKALMRSSDRSKLRLWRQLFLDSSSTDYRRQGIYRPTQRARFNIIRNACETQQAKVAGKLPRPWIVTTGGKWSMQRKAKRMGQFVEGDWERLGADNLRREQVLDACIYGTGVIKVYSEYNRVCMQRVWCGDLLTHRREEAANHVRTLYQIAAVDKGVLSELWPDDRRRIDALGRAPRDMFDDADEDDDLVCVMEAWRLPDGRDENGEAVGGRHAIVVDGATLLDEEWTRDHFPFSMLRASRDPARLFGRGFPDRMAGAQSEQNYISELVSDIARKMTPKYVTTGGKLTVEQLSNDIEFWELIGQGDVKVLSADAALFGAVQYAAQQRQAAYQEQGIDTYTAESSKPADLSSGKAALVHRDITSERWVIFQLDNDQATIDLCKLHVEECEAIVEAGGGDQLVAHAGKGTLDELKWSDVSLGDNPYVVRVAAVSKLSGSPQGQLAQLTEMLASGMVTLEEARELYDMPDLERSNNLNFARRDLSRKLIEAALDRKPTPATEVCDLAYLVECGMQQYALAQTQGASEDELVDLLDLVGAAQAIIASKAAMNAPPPMAALPAGPVGPDLVPPPAAPAPPLPPIGSPPGMLQ